MLPLILASGSPRRRELLAQMGVDFEVVVSEADENLAGDPRQVVETLALRKADAVRGAYADRFILAADTLVSVDGEVFGKPRDEGDALRMVRALSGRSHQVYSGVCLYAPHRAAPLVRHAVTEVRFAPMSEREIGAYVASGEPFGKAGGYAIQGLAGMYVQSIRGSFSNVVGLPTCLVREMLRECNYPLV